MKSTWILIADSSRARIFSADSAFSPLVEIEDMLHLEGQLHDREITSDLPGKIKGDGGIGGHAFEQPTDPKQHEADNFAHRIALFLEEARNLNKFDHLMIVAAPSFLGLLRSRLPEKLRKKVCFELDKNITGLAANDIRQYLPLHFRSREQSAAAS